MDKAVCVRCELSNHTGASLTLPGHTTQGCVPVRTCSPRVGMVCRTHKPITSLYEGKCQHLGTDCVAKFVPHTTRIVRVLNSSWVCLPCARDIMFPNDRDDKALLLERLVLHAVHMGGIEGQTCVLLRNILSGDSHTLIDAGPGVGAPACLGTHVLFHTRLW